LCNELWTGVDCSVKKCLNNCNDRGVCKDGTCVCLNGFEGKLCENVVCPNQCSGNILSRNGICDTKTGICKCKEGYTSEDCSLRTCLNDCSGNGICDARTGSCNCYP
jgi:syndecan 4